MKKILFSDLIAGVVVGVILTTTGVLVQYNLQVQSEKQQAKVEDAKLLINRVNGRYYRARNIILSSGSSVFDDRWDDYIVNGLYPWDIDFYLLDHFLKSNDASLGQDFEDVNALFSDLHSVLIRLKNAQGLKSPDQLKSKELEAKIEFDQLTSKLEPFLESILNL